MNAIIKNNGHSYSDLLQNFLGKEHFNEFLSPGFGGQVPAVNVEDSVEGFKLEVIAPGFEKGDFKLNLDRNQLTISVQKEQNSEQSEKGVKKYTRQEYKFSSFKRTFGLPVSVDTEKIEASYENGVLLVTLPKKEEAKPKPARSIEIS